jgi:hypothetical protein
MGCPVEMEFSVNLTDEDDIVNRSSPFFNSGP